MGELAQGSFALVAITGCLVLIALIYALIGIRKVVFAFLFKLADAIDFLILFANPAHDAVNAVDDAIADALDSALAGVEGELRRLFSGLIDAFGMLIAIPALLALGVKAALVYLWHDAIRPLISAVVKPVRELAQKAEAQVVALETTVARNLVTAERYAAGQATRAYEDAAGFTRREITAVRQDFTRADAAIDARLDGIGTQAQAIAGDIAASPGLVWDDLKKYLDPTDLAQATILGVLGALGIHSLTTDTGLGNADCRGKVRGVCQTDTGQWLKFLEGLALLGFAFDFRELVAFAESLAGDVKPLVEAVK